MSTSGTNTDGTRIFRTDSLYLSGAQIRYPTPHPSKRKAGTVFEEKAVSIIRTMSEPISSRTDSASELCLQRAVSIRSHSCSISIRDEKSSVETELDSIAGPKIDNVITRVAFDCKISREEYPTQDGTSQEIHYYSTDLYEGAKKAVLSVPSERKPTQSQDHFLRQKEAIKTFFLSKIPVEEQDKRLLQYELNQTILMLAERGNNTTGLKELIDGDEPVWTAFHTHILKRVKGSLMKSLVNDLFAVETRQRLLQPLLEKAYRYHFSTREDFKREFHIQKG